MKATQTQIEAFHSIDPATLCKSKNVIYKYLKANPRSTRQEISDGSGITINRCTGRVNELIHDGLIVVVGKKLNNSGRLAETLEVSE